jgi:hypothetical protein
MIRWIAPIAIVVSAPALAVAQPAERSIEAVVVDAASGQPVAGALVVAGGVEATSGGDGAVVLAGVAAGAVDVLVVADGYEELLTSGRAGRPLRLALRKVADGNVAGVEVIEISGDAPLADEPPTYDVPVEQVRTLPGSGSDALKALQSLPGVARVPFGLGGLVLRGSSPRDSSVFLDGIEVPILYHFGGLASFFPTAMLDSMELMPGSFGARFGRAIGGIVDLRSRAGQADRWRGAAEMSLVDASARAEGPLLGGAISVGVRRSYVDAVLAAAAPDLTLAPRYLDAQLRYDLGSERRGRWTLLAFASDDLLRFVDEPEAAGDDEDTFRYVSRFVRAGVRWQRDRDGLALSVMPTVGYDESTIRFDEDGITRENLPIALRAEVKRSWSGGYLAGGVDGQLVRSSFDLGGEVGPGPGVMGGDVEMRRLGATWSEDGGVWAEGFVRLWNGALGIKPGLRVDHFGLSDQVVADPRLTISHELSPRVTLTESVGLYHQPPASADLDPAWGNQDLRASRSVQTAAGLQIAIPDFGEASSTLYYQALGDLPVDAVTGATAAADGGSVQSGGVGAISRELTDEQFGSYAYRENVGRGRSYGLEMLVRRRVGDWQGWVAYTYARAKRRGDPRLDPRWYPYVLDQPHVLTALVSARITHHWQIGARVRLATGNPITPAAGSYYDADDQEYEPVDGPILSERLPDFVQLDVRVDRNWRRSWGTVRLYLDLQNATNRLNAEGVSYNYDYSRKDYTRGLPIFPSIGVEYVP